MSGFPIWARLIHTAKVRAAIGPGPMICVEQAIILSTEAAKARARARSYMKTYVQQLPNYVNNLKNLGWADAEFENGCRDKLVDAIVAWGTEKPIQDRIEAHLKAVEVFARFNKLLTIDPRASPPKVS